MLKLSNYYDVMEYDREIDVTGSELVLFRIDASEVIRGRKFHLFYGMPHKTPMDAAFNPEKGTLQYLKFMLVDTKIKKERPNISLELFPYNLSVSSETFSFKKSQLEFEKGFEVYFFDDTVMYLESEDNGKKFGYELNKENYILINESNDIAGVLLKNLSKDEVNLLKEAEVI